MTRSLDLGCGPHPKNPFSATELYGVDVSDFHSGRIRSADLAVEPIPFDDDFFDYVTAYDFIEHIPRVVYCPKRRHSFIELMNEIYRVLKMDGCFFSQTPAYPHPEVFQDPNHVNIITDHTFFYYFDDKFRWAGQYGFTGAFRIISQEWQGFHLLTKLQKVPVTGC